MRAALLILLLNLFMAGHIATAAPSCLDVLQCEEQKTHQQLSDELTQRWETTIVPSFLEEKKSDIAEIMDQGLRMPLEILREILASDDVIEIEKNSEIYERNTHLYSSIQHQTKLKYLIENLRRGELEPRSSEVHYSRHGVYLELHLHSNPKPFAWGDVELHFDSRVLDRTDYHINPYWSYGNYDPNSASPAVNMGRTNYFLRKLLNSYSTQNELVFHNPVSLMYLKKIIVPMGKKLELIKELETRKISSSSGIEWHQLITESVMTPRDLSAQENN